MPPDVKAYLNTALDTIRQNALKSNAINWDDLRKEAFKRASDAMHTEDLQEVLAYTLSQLDDNHSFLQKGGRNLSYPDNNRETGPSPYGDRMKIEYGVHREANEVFARLFVPQGMRDNEFAQQLQNIIANLQTLNPSGWIVDLRGNGGGNMWPMLAGIGPLMGQNPLGGSAYSDNAKDYYRYEEGKAVYVDPNGNPEVYAKAEKPVENVSEEIPIAFLIDRGTASSGEALAVILKGRNNTKSFGEHTYGASTGTKGFLLSDSLNLVLAVSTFLDRNGKMYIDGVEPDVTITIGTDKKTPKDDPVIAAALAWLIHHSN